MSARNNENIAHDMPGIPENPNEIRSIEIGGETRYLGSLQAELKLRESKVGTIAEAKREIDDLISEGFLPVFPFDLDSETLDHIIDNGIDPKESLLQTMQGKVVGTIGKLHRKSPDRFLVVIYKPEEISNALEPRFTGRERHFIGALSPSKHIDKDHIIILDADTLEALHAPDGVDISDGLSKVVEAVKAKIRAVQDE